MSKAPAPVVAAADGVLDATFSLTWLVAFISLVAVGVSTVIIGVGFFVLAFAVLGTTWYLGADRRRTAAAYELALPDQPRRLTQRRGWLRSLSQAWLDVRDPLWWKTLGHHVITGLLGLVTWATLSYLVGGGIAEILSPLVARPEQATTPPTGWHLWLPSWPPAMALPLGAVFLALAAGVLTANYHIHRALSVSMLDIGDETLLRRQLADASAQRDGAVRTVETDRRRIERDLHDGVQPQLVNVGMMLSMAQSKLESDPETAKALIAEAHAGTKTAIGDLRQLGRGIHPAVLADSGLDAALSALVAQFAIPVTLDINLPGRCRPEAEAAAYFTVAESLTNSAKHSGATGCAVRVRSSEGSLLVDVADNGRGGAAILPHGGLAGLHDRLAAVGGRLTVASTNLGTTISAVLPCA